MKELNKLTFRRQYLIAPKEITPPFISNLAKIHEHFYLYTHTDLLVTQHIKLNNRLILLGDLFDYKSDHKSNSDILKELIDLSFDDLLKKLSIYTGRYVLIASLSGRIRLVHDCIASRKIYYGNIDNCLWIASQPYVIGKVLHLKETTNTSRKSYYESATFSKLNNSNIGDTTIYDEVFQVLPNHYFDVDLTKSVRYYPNRRIETTDFQIAAKEVAKIVQGYMENIVARYNVMLPVTAGKDSRLLLAATKNINNKLFYYINKGSNLSLKSDDIRIPNKLFIKLGLAYNIIDIIQTADPAFISILNENNPFCQNKYYSIFYNYYKNFEDKVNLPGNIAFESFYRALYPGLLINSSSIAEIIGVKEFKFAIEYFDQWLKETEDISAENNIHVLNLLYWEERMGNWGTQTQVDKDIAQEEVNPFNSRLLTELFLSIDYQYLSPPSYKFHKEVINVLWPEVLLMPINPSFRNYIKRILETSGILILLFNIKNYLKSLKYKTLKTKKKI
ncbi:MAG: hypothetical protein JXB49_32695 [Bacteroidales bacterium]|nr:hypothetical protein [Bacteroidales bacterium]